MANSTLAKYRDRTISGAVLLIGLIIAYAAFVEIRRNNRDALERDFELAAVDTARSVEFQFNRLEDALAAVRSLYDSSNYVDENEFNSFVETISQRTPIMRAAGWAPLVAGEAAAEGKAFTLEYAFAVDGSHEVETLGALWRETDPKMLNALAKDPTFASLRLLRVDREQDESQAILIALPVYAQAQRETGETPPRSLAGILIGLAYPPELKAMALKRLTSANQLTVSISHHASAAISAPPEQSQRQFFQHTYQFKFAGHYWTLLFEPKSSPRLAGLDAWLSAVGILALFSAIAAFINHQIHQRHVVERIVEMRTHDLKEERDRIKLAMIATADGFLDWDCQKNVVNYSEQFFRLLGYENQESFKANVQSWTECIHPDDSDAVKSAINKHIIQRDPLDMSLRLGRKGSEDYRWFRISGRALWNEAGIAERMAISISDIDDLIKSQKKAEEASELKSQFLANMSHEIRTPLNGVLGMAQILSRSSLDGSQKEYVKTITSSGTALLALINNVLDLSKIEAGLFHLDNDPFEMQKLIASAVDTIAGIATQKNITIKTDIHPAYKGCYIGDMNRLRQVLTNLAGNAVKFMDEGEVTISVQPIKGGLTRFSIKDTGPGMKKDQLEVIFDRFRQADAAASRKHGGTGLGLAISSDIVKRAGGEIKVESTPGKGSTFWFDIPLERAGGLAIEVDENDDGDESPEERRPCRVLVAEDNPVNQMVLRAALEPKGHIVRITENGRQALDALEEEAFDLVLMDIQMPVMSGDEALKVIRQSEKPYADIPVLVLTAHAMEGAREEYLSMGANGYIAKPINIENLCTAIAAYRPPMPKRRAGAA